MPIRLSGIVIIVGNYGSGKTEVAINLAVQRKKNGLRVRVADLDLVNPYFRTREARQTLEALDIDLVLPADPYLQADLPILVPQVAGMIRNPGDLDILDMGGDDVGATVLAALADAFRPLGDGVHVLQVVNPFRPNTDTVARCLKMRRAIEAGARMAVTGWVGNANLIEETTAEHVNSGMEFMGRLEAESDLPVEFVTVPQPILEQMDTAGSPWPVLPIHRQLVPPWIRPTPWTQPETAHRSDRRNES